MEGERSGARQAPGRPRELDTDQRVVQNGFVIAALIVSYAVFSFGPYLVWPNRWNIVGHLLFGLFFVQYLDTTPLD